MKYRWLYIILLIIAIGVSAVLKEFLKSSQQEHYQNQNSNLLSKQKDENLQAALKKIDSIQSADKDFCIFKTIGLDKAKGVDMEIKIPCNWAQSDFVKSTTVKQFSPELGDSATIGASLDISDLGFSLTDEQIKQATTKENLEKLHGGDGILLEGKSVTINGRLGDEVIIKRNNKTGSKIRMYMLINHFYYKNYLITITYFAGSYKEEKATKLFEDNKLLFRKLGSATIIH